MNRLKIVAISDTHGYHREIDLPEGDILVHSGDSTSTGEFSEYRAFLRWFLTRPHKHKVFINGNHEVSVSRAMRVRTLIEEISTELMTNNFYYLENSGATVEGLKFWGSPYTPEFFPEYWAYQLRTSEQAKACWDLIPDDTDVMISHGPVFGKMDKVTPFDRYDREHAGCPHLLEKILAVKPKLFISGHIHSGYGAVAGVDTLFVNASTCDEAYKPINKPIEIWIDKDTKKVELI